MSSKMKYADKPGDRQHFESMRCGISPSIYQKWKRGGRVAEANKARSDKIEQFCSRCNQCERKALYRYFKKGIGWYGRCREHKQ